MLLDRFPTGLQVPQEWLDGIVTQLRATGVDIVKQHLLTVMQDYFRHSNCWRMWVGPMVAGGPSPPVPGRRIPVDPPAPNVSVRTIYAVKGADNVDLGRIDPRAYDMAEPRLGGMPGAFYQAIPGTVVFDQVPPAEAEPFTCGLYVSLSPNDLCLPPALHAEHYDALCQGTLARLTRVRGPNFNMAISADYRRDYVRARSRARWDAEAGYSQENTRATSPAFARGRQRRGQAVWRN